MSDQTFQECPVCGRRMCDHTEEERGGPFTEAQPRLPTLGFIMDQQGGKCAECPKSLGRWYEVIPLRGSLICASCFHRVSAVDRLGEVGRTPAGGHDMIELSGNQLANIKTPHLPNEQRAQLMEALGEFAKGRRVELAFRYKRTTEGGASIPGEDYRPRLAHGPDILEGQVKDVTKGKNGWYILIDATLTRQPVTGTGEPKKDAIGWRSIKGEGMTDLLGVRCEGEALPPAQ